MVEGMLRNIEAGKTALYAHKATWIAPTAVTAWAPNCATGPAPAPPTKVPTGCGWTCGRPTSACKHYYFKQGFT